MSFLIIQLFKYVGSYASLDFKYSALGVHGYQLRSQCVDDEMTKIPKPNISYIRGLFKNIRFALFCGDKTDKRFEFQHMKQIKCCFVFKDICDVCKTIENMYLICHEIYNRLDPFYAQSRILQIRHISLPQNIFYTHTHFQEFVFRYYLFYSCSSNMMEMDYTANSSFKFSIQKFNVL